MYVQFMSCVYWVHVIPIRIIVPCLYWILANESQLLHSAVFLSSKICLEYCSVNYFFWKGLIYKKLVISQWIFLHLWGMVIDNLRSTKFSNSSNEPSTFCFPISYTKSFLNLYWKKPLQEVHIAYNFWFKFSKDELRTVNYHFVEIW